MACWGEGWVRVLRLVGSRTGYVSGFFDSQAFPSVLLLGNVSMRFSGNMESFFPIFFDYRQICTVLKKTRDCAPACFSCQCIWQPCMMNWNIL